MPSATNDAGSLGRQIAFALAAAIVAAVAGTAQGLVPTLIDLSTETVWLISAAGALSSLVAALVAGAAGYAAGLRDAEAGTVLRTVIVFAGAAVLAYAAAAVVFGLLAPNAGVTPPLAAAAGVAGRTVPFVAGGVAGAALSRARNATDGSRDASYSAAHTNSEV
ncbi:hypothetical protein [Halobaculum roseum]|uniref:Major facilitator superfamily (MFS) profile domain-containing protein n=1 Tax=Halobaculum roseum TaxID=2175149 RepID=A0ABD5MLJ1_9EURY|nr:hypothetical protein [Halobaculum roseum]QZY03923.1 hypothetical protein K6T36_07105 [Halobaculum roseum]